MPATYWKANNISKVDQILVILIVYNNLIETKITWFFWKIHKQ